MATPAQAAEGDAAKGKQVFQDNCAICHSAETDEMIVGPGLKGLFKWPPHKLSDGTEHKEHTVEIIRKQIAEGGCAMSPMGEVRSAEQITDVIAYLKTL
jgi:mono/diheme cytochrome c family protein